VAWVATGIAAGSALLGAVGSNKAADAQTSANDAAIAEQQRQYNQTRNDLAPYRTVGGQALNALAGIYGYQPAPIEGVTGPYSGQPTNPAAQTFGGSPLNQTDWQNANGAWGLIRQAANFGDINWNDPRLANLQLSPEARQFLTNNWSNVRRAANFGDINWSSPTIIGAPQYQQAAPAAAPVQAPAGNSLTDQHIPEAGGMPRENALAQPAPAATAAPGPDYSSFFKSPDYTFRQQQGMQGIQNSFAARGGAASGNALKALTEFNSNLAAGEFGNYFNRQAGLAGVGQTATNTGAAYGAGAAGNIGNALQSSGDARASGILGTYGAINNAGQNIAGNYLYRQPISGQNSAANNAYWSQYGQYGY
jgi:hypothetical protein